MRSFRYACPRTLSETFDLLQTFGPRATVLAGGTDVAVRLRRGRQVPELVVDVKRVQGLCGTICETGSARIRIGALAVMRTVIEDVRVRELFPALVEAAKTVGSVQIRNRATVVGNICNASPAADTAPALLAYGAVVNLVSRTGSRCVALNDFFTGPGRTILECGEIVESIDLPIPDQPTGAAFCRLTRRRGVDLASVNVACVVTGSGEMRLAFGAVGPRPILVTDDEVLLGKAAASASDKDARLTQLIRGATPITDLRASREYRTAMLLVLSRRALEAAVGRLRSGGMQDDV